MTVLRNASLATGVGLTVSSILAAVSAGIKAYKHPKGRLRRRYLRPRPKPATIPASHFYGGSDPALEPVAVLPHVAFDYQNTRDDFEDDATSYDSPSSSDSGGSSDSSSGE